MPVKQVKKGNFLLFGVVMVFQIVEPMFGRLIRQSKYIPQIRLDYHMTIQMYPV